MIHPPTTDELSKLRDNILLARRLAWLSAIHRSYLADLEHQARSHNLKV